MRDPTQINSKCNEYAYAMKLIVNNLKNIKKKRTGEERIGNTHLINSEIKDITEMRT